MKKLTSLNKINNKTLFLIFTLTYRPMLLFLIINIIFILSIIYFFTDTVLCQGLDESQAIEFKSKDIGDNSHLERLNALKSNMEDYIIKGNKSIKEHDDWVNLLKEALRRPEKNRDIELYLQNKAEESLRDYHFS